MRPSISTVLGITTDGAKSNICVDQRRERLLMPAKACNREHSRRDSPRCFASLHTDACIATSPKSLQLGYRRRIISHVLFWTGKKHSRSFRTNNDEGRGASCFHRTSALLSRGSPFSSAPDIALHFVPPRSRCGDLPGADLAEPRTSFSGGG
jgi:hypothetical protein